MIDNIRLPEEIESGAKGGPLFQTSVIALASGAEQRNEDWADSRQKWDVGYGVQDAAGYNAVRDFFYARRAKGRGFMFKDWSDYSVTGQVLGTSDGVTRTYLLVRTYENSGPDPYVRRITRPVTGTLKVYCNGVLKTEGLHYVTGAGGWFRFLPGYIPPALEVITADFEWDTPVRFDVDEFPLQLAWVEAGEISSLPIIEERDPFNGAPTAVNLTNTSFSLAESTSTASHVHIADIEVVDDPFGTDVVTLTGADAAFFELVGTINADRTGVALYLKAGTPLAYLLKNAYHVTVNADDATIAGGAHPQAHVDVTLNITQVNLAPSISLINTTVVEPDGTSTASPIHVADVRVLDDGLGLRAVTITGADAASFQLSGSLSASGTDPATGKTIYTGIALQTVAGLNYSIQKIFSCVVNVADSGLASPPQGTVPFTIQFGVIPGSFTDITPGSRSIVVPAYTTLIIDMWGPGAGAGGFNTVGHDGTADTTIVSLGLTAGRGKTTAGSLIGGAGGIATGGDTNSNGTPGANGTDYAKSYAITEVMVSFTNPSGFQFSTAAGGNNGEGVNGAPSTPGPFFAFGVGVPNTQYVNGGPGVFPAGGGAGSVAYGILSESETGGFITIATYAKGAAGGGGGAKLRKTYIYGVTAGAPAPGSTLPYVIGTKGLGGVSFANGGDGADGKIQFTWS